MGNHLNLENVSLENIAKALQKINKKVQLIYAFNGTGKTRLSLEFYNLFNGDIKENIKISNGEENNFIWCHFYTLLQIIIDNNKEAIPTEIENFEKVKCVYIDDPVSSLDDNHLIELAVNLAELIKKSNLKFIISTHNFTFYNILYNHLDKESYFLTRNSDNTFNFKSLKGGSNVKLNYHLFLLKMIAEAKKSNELGKIHFMYLRNIYEKTAALLGYKKWGDLLPDENKESYLRRLTNYRSHSENSEITPNNIDGYEIEVLNKLYDHLLEKFNYQKFWETKDEHK